MASLGCGGTRALPSAGQRQSRWSRVAPIAARRGASSAPASALLQQQRHRLPLTAVRAAAADGDEAASGPDASASAAAPDADTSGFVMAESDYSWGASGAMGDDEMTAEDVKAALLDSFYGTERGLSARSEVRAEINELITQLEAKNPNPSPTEMLSALSGDWKLVYTSNSELLAVLALGKLPFVTVGDITQRVDAAAGAVENRVRLSAPLSRTSLSTTASFEVRSPKRIAVRFERGGIATPELLSDIEVPDTISVLGQTLDLSPFRPVLQPAGEALSGLLSAVGGAVKQVPDLTFPLPGARQGGGAGGAAGGVGLGGGGGGAGETWLLTTYLDEDTRITRGDGGSVFVLTREVSVQDPSAIIEPTATVGAASGSNGGSGGSGEAPAGYI